jgi:hypothetical protein
MSKFVTRFLNDESGATAIEYGLIVALIAVVIATDRHHARHQPGRHLQEGRHTVEAPPTAAGRLVSRRSKKEGPGGNAGALFFAPAPGGSAPRPRKPLLHAIGPDWGRSTG